MQRQPIPRSYEDKAKGCAVCPLRQAADQSSLDVALLLKQYARALRQFMITQAEGGRGELARQAGELHNRLDEFADLGRDEVESRRAADAVLFSLYYLVSIYGLGNRLRPGVDAHDAYMAFAKEAGARAMSLFEQVARAHNLLIAAYREAQQDDGESALQRAFEALEHAQCQILRDCIDTFWTQLEVLWLRKQRDGAYDVLGDLLTALGGQPSQS